MLNGLTNICFSANISSKMKVYSTSEAAKALSVTPKMITYLLRHGRLNGRKLGHDWVIFDLTYDRRPRGRPRKEI